MRRKNILKSCMLSLFLFSVLHSLVFLPFFFSPNSMLGQLNIPTPWSFHDTLFQTTYFFVAFICLFLFVFGLTKLIKQGWKTFFSGLSIRTMFYTGGVAAAIHLISIASYFGYGSYYHAEFPETVVEVDSYGSFFISLQSVPEILLEFICVVLSMSALLTFLVFDGKEFLTVLAQFSRKFSGKTTIALAFILIWVGYAVIVGSGVVWGQIDFLFYLPLMNGAPANGISYAIQSAPIQYKAMVLAYIILELMGLLALVLASSFLLLWMRNLFNKKRVIWQSAALVFPAVILCGLELGTTFYALASHTSEASRQFYSIAVMFPAINVYVMFFALLASSILLCRNAGKEKLGYTAKAEMQ